MKSNLSIFKSKTGEEEFLKSYDEVMKLWEVAYEEVKIPTQFGETHVIISGPKDGIPIVMLHGMTGNSSFWYQNITALQTYRVYCIDTLGDFGKSLVQAPLKTEEDCVLWLDEVFNGLGIHNIHLIGHSMGGWLSLNYARKRQENLRKLVLIAPVASILPIPFIKLAWYIYPSMLFPSEKRIKKGWKWFCAKGNDIHPIIMQQIITAYKQCRPLLAVIPKSFPKEELSGLKIPILFIVGDEEKIYRANKARKTIKEKIPHVETTIIPNCGHLLITEQATKVNKAIVDFLVREH
ncbi:alpha/beta hydrolase [Siminovitchia acidinfaciens]|uniref:Alpha/beta hydrolase n=1 Tax=Siminovitchia acidinfaciens TaxID=2321395 RepID=A0A429XWN5_9BACI|nr:alpha/beta hydrolase [Siminovitchia acidinfaciens]RST72798.1 alpha/beta hydrolase [Siminovitchia acidinfaciens]